MTKPIHTAWMPCTDHPVRNGVYQRRRIPHHAYGTPSNRYSCTYALFENGIWCCEARTPFGALKHRGNPSAYQTEADWRGRLESA